MKYIKLYEGFDDLGFDVDEDEGMKYIENIYTKEDLMNILDESLGNLQEITRHRPGIRDDHRYFGYITEEKKFLWTKTIKHVVFGYDPIQKSIMIRREDISDENGLNRIANEINRYPMNQFILKAVAKFTKDALDRDVKQHPWDKVMLSYINSNYNLDALVCETLPEKFLIWDKQFGGF